MKCFYCETEMHISEFANSHCFICNTFIPEYLRDIANYAKYQRLARFDEELQKLKKIVNALSEERKQMIEILIGNEELYENDDFIITKKIKERHYKAQPAKPAHTTSMTTYEIKEKPILLDFENALVKKLSNR